MATIPHIKHRFYRLLMLLPVLLSLPFYAALASDKANNKLITIADARAHPATLIDLGEVGDSVGDMFSFDQPLLDENRSLIGNNSGICFRTLVGHSLQCQWTLTFIEDSKTVGSVQVAGREFDTGTSVLSIVGGSGIYLGVRGELRSTNNQDGTFTQVLIFAN